MAAPLRIAVVGVGKIARDQHLPALAANPDYELVGTVTRQPDTTLAVPNFRTIADLVAGVESVAAVSLCTPPVGRHALAQAALDAGLDVMLEKPPGATLSEVDVLVARADAGGRCLFATWHSREAPAVAPARAWLADRRIDAVAIRWLEDVRHWHPGQAWIWEPGGLGVFDPGINALSIATAILPRPLFLTAAELFVPANRQTPIAANLTLTDSAATPMTATFDWRQQGEQVWEIRVQTDAGELWLSEGGAALQLPGEALVKQAPAEYPGLYRRFATLVRARRSDVDLSPLTLAADAFLLGRRTLVDAFRE